MQSQVLSKRTLYIVIFAGLVIFVGVFYYYFSRNLNLSVAQPNSPRSDGQAQGSLAPLTQNVFASPKQDQVTSGSPDLPTGRPVRLKIPGINVDSAVESVGLTPDGAMGVPKSFANVAWFNLGQRPGEIGSAVIAGHYGVTGGKASVFDNLHKLSQGDKIYIENDRGVTISFVVRESRQYDPGADASSVFGSNDGKSRLNLVTCEGIWDEVSQSYSQRLVVFADKEVE